MTPIRRGLAFSGEALARGFPSLWWVIGLATIVAGGSLAAVLPFALDRPLLAAGIIVAATVLTFGIGAYRLYAESASLVMRQAAELESLRNSAPSLSFGRAAIPSQSQKIVVLDSRGAPREIGRGRVIRVPVINAIGGGVAFQVHARLTFMPADQTGAISPRDPAQGEWLDEPRPEIDMPGNGRPHMLDVAVVLDGEYPHVYEWTAHSRAAGLAGYAIKASPVDVKIVVMGSAANQPHLCDVLQIELHQGILRADWVSRSADEATNWVPCG